MQQEVPVKCVKKEQNIYKSGWWSVEWQLLLTNCCLQPKRDGFGWCSSLTFGSSSTAPRLELQIKLAPTFPERSPPPACQTANTWNILTICGPRYRDNRARGRGLCHLWRANDRLSEVWGVYGLGELVGPEQALLPDQLRAFAEDADQQEEEPILNQHPQATSPLQSRHLCGPLWLAESGSERTMGCLQQSSSTRKKAKFYESPKELSLSVMTPAASLQNNDWHNYT